MGKLRDIRHASQAQRVYVVALKLTDDRGSVTQRTVYQAGALRFVQRGQPFVDIGACRGHCRCRIELALVDEVEHASLGFGCGNGVGKQQRQQLVEVFLGRHRI